MKRFLSIVFFTTIFASATLAQNATTTTQGGGPDLTVQSAKGTTTLKDTTVHTTLPNGVVVSTSTGTDGKPNGGVGSSGGSTNGGSTPPPTR
jgi:hypothetical protein